MASGGDERWTTLKAIFAEAMQRPPEAREAFLRQRCGSDEALLAELLALVRAGPADDAGLRDIVAEAAGEVTGGGADGERRLGPYRLIRPIGEGGMGTVWLGERADEQYRKKVAVKILRPGGDPSLASRFRTERQMLADLDHPNIARLLDGGETEGGRPWLAMEYVDGLPITDYCDRHRLGIEARLRLFLACCRAVQHAHRRLIIHRDIKPSNILVDEAGTPYLLDFGIAKLLDAGQLQHTVAVTQHAARIMTPGHASPEQVRGETVTTATDIYSLGILLYQLLSGHFPYAVEGSTAAELERAICEREPTKPSSRVTGAQTWAEAAESDAADVGDARGTTVGRLRKVLAGDLDNIVMVALRKEPDRRYESVSALMADVRAWLERRPVSARADSAGYRLGKFLRRNAAGVTAAAGLAVLLAGIVSYYTWQLAAERDRARTEAQVANQATDFLVTLFEAANPKRTNPEEISPGSLLDEGRLRIEEDLADAPRVRGRLLSALGAAYRAMGDYETALTLGDEALRIYDELYADRPAQAAPAKAALAHSLAQAGRLEEAAALFREALAELRGAGESAGRMLAGALNNYGMLLNKEGQFTRAEAVLEEVLAMARAGRDVPGRLRAHVMVNRAIARAGQSRYVEAVGDLERAQALLEELGESANFPLAAVHLSMGNYLGRLGESDEAMVHLDRAVALMEKTLGTSHPDYAGALMARSNLLGVLGRNDEAEQDIRAAVAVRTEALGGDHPAVGLAHHYLGTFLWRQRGRPEAAVEQYRHALAVYDESLRADHPYRVYTLNSLGSIRLQQGRHEDAVARFDEALSLAEESLPPDHQQVVYAYRELGRLYRERGDYAAARSRFEEGLGRARRDGSYPYTFEPLLEEYAELAEELGDEALARRLREELAELNDGA